MKPWRRLFRRGDPDPTSVVEPRVSQHPPSLAPTAAEALNGPHRSTGWVAIPIVVLAILLAAPTLFGNHGESGAAAAPAAVHEPATRSAVPVAPPAEPASEACADPAASGAHQFIEIEETRIVGTAAPE